MNWVLQTSARVWEFLCDANTVLRPCRFSAIVVAAGAALLFSSQGLEFTVRLPAEGPGKILSFYGCVFLWAFQSWYWARLVLDVTFGADRNAPLTHARSERLRGLIVHTPRVMAAGSYLVALAGCLLAGWAAVWVGIGLAVQGVLFYWFLVIRRSKIVDKLVSVNPAGSPNWKYALLLERGADPTSLQSLPLLSRIILWLTLTTAAALTVWVCIDAVGFGWFFGAAAVPFLGFSTLVPAGSLLVFWAREGGARWLPADPLRSMDTARAYPVIAILLVIALVFSFFPWLDNHNVRTLPAPEAESDRPGLDQVLDQWRAQTPRFPDGRSNFVVVSAAGGGLRAAFWTATVLGAIQDGAGDFRRELFGVSAVSGGSLGAAAFVTLASQVSMSDGIGGCPGDRASAGPYECAGQTVLSQDFLGPAVAALLFPDLMQRFFPLGFPDRAKALEQSWERAWGRAGFQEDIWRDRGFRSLWTKDNFSPALFLNGTHVETGKRVITSNVNIAASPTVFRDAYDFYRLVPGGSEIRPSTAAHNSARFTYVSPAGTLSDGTHTVDGGYFENFGAVTGRDVLKAGIERWGRTIQPVAILISNDPNLKEEDFRPSELRSAKPKTWAGELLSPLRALLQTRDARGLLAASEMRALVEENGGKYFQFRLCEEPGRPEPALGWVLSRDSEDLMRAQLRSKTCGNSEQLRALLQTLRGG
jgi:hypothetical protein